MGGATKVVEDFGQGVVDVGDRALTGLIGTDPLNPFPQGTGGGGGGGIFGDISNAFTRITQPIEKAVTAGVEDTSKNLTTVFQPVEKAVNYVGAHPEIQLAIAMAVAVPVVGEYIGAELMAAGAVTGAEAAYGAAIAEGATAAEAAAAAEAATATATVMGTAIASTSVQVAQGVPIEQAIQNTAADVAVSQLSPEAAKQLDGLLHSPAVTDAITSTVASGAATAARGGSQEEVEKAMTAGLAGSAASSAYKSVAQSSPDIYSKTIGGATAGAVKGGTEGAVIGGLAGAASTLKRPSFSSNLAADAGGGGDFETYSDPSTSGGAAPVKLEKPGDLYYDRAANKYYDPSQVDAQGNLIPNAKAYDIGGLSLQEVTVAGKRGQKYKPDITLPSGFKIPSVDVYGSNKPARTDFAPPPSSVEPEAPTEAPAETPAEEPPAEEAPADKPSVYKPDIFITTYKKPKAGASYSSTATLGSALGTAGTTTGLTAYRGAGEIEGTGTGKPRQKVWNEESLKLKDALGV